MQNDRYVVLSCRVPQRYADRLKAITQTEEVSVHHLLINLLDKFMDEYEKED